MKKKFIIFEVTEDERHELRKKCLELRTSVKDYIRKQLGMKPMNSKRGS